MQLLYSIIYILNCLNSPADKDSFKCTTQHLWGWTVPNPFAPLQLRRGGKCKHARLQREGQTDKSHHRGNVFKMSNMCFSILTFCSQADMQIIVGTVAVCSFLSDPVLFLFPAWPHPHQCQLYIGSQQPPTMWRALFLFPTPDFFVPFCVSSRAMVISRSRCSCSACCVSAVVVWTVIRGGGIAKPTPTSLSNNTTVTVAPVSSRMETTPLCLHAGTCQLWKTLVNTINVVF